MNQTEKLLQEASDAMAVHLLNITIPAMREIIRHGERDELRLILQFAKDGYSNEKAREKRNIHHPEFLRELKKLGDMVSAKLWDDGLDEEPLSLDEVMGQLKQFILEMNDELGDSQSETEGG